MKGVESSVAVIAALVIAIIVILIGSFLLSTYSGTIFKQTSEDECRNMIYNYCFQWSLNNWERADEDLKNTILEKCKKYLEPPGPFVGFKENTLEYCKTYVPGYR
jgi:hypothetical protein